MKTARCSSCGLDTHLYCQGSGLEQEEEEPVTCLMCEARGGGGKDTNKLRALVHKKLLEKATKNIQASTNKLRELERRLQELVNTMKRLEQRREAGMGLMEKRFEACLDNEVKAFRQTYASCSLTGSGIANVLAGRRKLVAVFEGTKWFRPYTDFLENYSAYHHLAMSTRPLGERGLATLETAIRNLSVILAYDFKTRITPKMDILLTVVVPFARKWNNLGIFREEKVESLHAKINILERILACIRKSEMRLLAAFQRQELKDAHRQLGKVVKKGPRKKKVEEEVERMGGREKVMEVEAREDVF